MLELIICLVVTVYSFPKVFLFISDSGSGKDEVGCGVSFDRGCKSFSYVFNARFNGSIMEKALLLSDGYNLSDNGGVIFINGDTPYLVLITNQVLHQE
jgi:hypothetical protein